MNTPPLAARAEEEQIDGAPERVGAVIGALITIGSFALVLWPVARIWL
ncbi:hypothetical protein G6N74_16080 [Mesorhizobium sp. CGMCC 1.15528]|jgi:hypothetical protein|uniref:Uncharacterized protein n=1 Tax=Mesorhizobium zhangyense TaxID=1776730 RepID=A0A7C9VCQ4_9HYPH|nr:MULTISPECIES: hypothetical protein [Mesorhizobium]NGN42587.1 hypothetical protein [Mesorhizobium zhangyense]SFT64321.1 hypothetical protein SAMN05518861_10399 [Mesorhizobium sp. YR577]